MKDFLAKLRHRKTELSAYLFYLFQRAKIPDKKFVIFAQGRTGSTLLYELLNSHPEVYCDKEIFF